MDQDTTLYFYAEDLCAPGCYSDTLSVSAFLNPPITMTIMDGVDAMTICDSECIDLTADVNGATEIETTTEASASGKAETLIVDVNGAAETATAPA